MICVKYKKEVRVKDCEECLSNRIAQSTCFKRRFIWGLPDDNEPAWVLTYLEARGIKWEKNKIRDDVCPDLPIYSTKKKATIPPEIRWMVWERDNFTCQECGKRKFWAIDHIYPESMGGTLEITNLQTLCKNCNSKKGSRI